MCMCVTLSLNGGGWDECLEEDEDRALLQTVADISNRDMNRIDAGSPVGLQDNTCSGLSLIGKCGGVWRSYTNSRFLLSSAALHLTSLSPLCPVHLTPAPLGSSFLPLISEPRTAVPRTRSLTPAKSRRSSRSRSKASYPPD